MTAKGKAPAAQFYFGDWLRDTELQMCSCSTKGIWINLLCHMWFARDRGELEGSPEEFQKLTGASTNEMDLFFKEAKRFKFCDISVTGHNTVTLINRRMSREDHERRKARDRKRKQREKDAKKQDVTEMSQGGVTEKSRLHSSTSSSTSTSNTKKKQCVSPNKFDEFWLVYPKKVGKKDCRDKWKRRKLNDIADRIIKDVQERKAKDTQWLRGYIPHPATYINGDRWEDEIQTKPAPDQKKKQGGFIDARPAEGTDWIGQ